MYRHIKPPVSRTLYISAFFGSVLGLLLPSCVKATRKLSHQVHHTPDTVAADEEEYSASGVQKWHVSPNRVVVLFGYGYNDADFVGRTLDTLYDRFGAAEDGGLIIPLVFPDDFKRGKDSVASELPSFASSDDTTLRGVLLLGAGENTNYGIAHLQDYYGGERTFPVFSLFGQDDTLGTEATSDFVLERVQEANVSGENASPSLQAKETSAENNGEDNAQAFVPEVEGMIERSIECFCALAAMTSYPCDGDAPTGVSLAWDEQLLLNVADIASPLSISRYIDGETRLQSVNHFVISD